MLWRVTPGSRDSPAMSISLSKWPILPRIALFFILVIRSAVTTSTQPVAVMMMSASPPRRRVRNLVTVHRRLQRADRVDLGDDHPGSP